MKYTIITIILLSCCIAQQPYDVKKIISPEECKVCHKKEFAVWQQTKHFTTYDSLHSSPISQKILKRLRLTGSPKKQELCNRCHYTLKYDEKRDRIRTIDAVACERCHGAAKDWVETHNVADIPKPLRREKASSLGMFHPGDIIGIANNCYSCHIIDDETLIDIGRHPIGNQNFKFVSETQGKMRHNFTSGGGENIPASVERKRLFYVVGTCLEIEYRLRALAKAKNEKNYFLATRNLLKNNVDELLNIHKLIERKETQYMLQVLQQVKANTNNEAELTKAADEIKKATHLLIKSFDVTTLPSIDALLPKDR